MIGVPGTVAGLTLALELHGSWPLDRVLEPAIDLADDGFQAGSLLREHLPCVMTLDLNMPGVSGYDVIEHVRMSPELRTTKILVVSAMPEEELQKAISIGADDVLPKPFQPNDLAAKVLQLAGTEIGA